MSGDNTTTSEPSCCEVGSHKASSTAGRLGVASALLAWACCGLPLLFIVLGLGGLGMGSVLGRYHWVFMGAGVVLLGAAWFVFLREKHRLAASGAAIRHKRLTVSLLTVATAVVVGFGALDLASSLGLGAKADEVSQAKSTGAGELAQVVLPVEGMTCFTCEVAVEKALGELDGVVEAKASAAEGKVLVRYTPGRVSFTQMVEAVHGAGYGAALPGS